MPFIQTLMITLSSYEHHSLFKKRTQIFWKILLCCCSGRVIYDCHRFITPPPTPTPTKKLIESGIIVWPPFLGQRGLEPPLAPPSCAPGCTYHPISRNFYPAGAAHAIFVQPTWICWPYQEHEQRPVTAHSAVPRLQSGTIFRKLPSRQALSTLSAID